MNAIKRNNILIASLESEDDNDDTYILPGEDLTFRVAYDESDWDQGVMTRKAFIEWTHYEEYTLIKCNPVLSPAKNWKIDNCECDVKFKERCDLAFDEVSSHIRKDYE